MTKRYDYTVFIGRFQPFHIGHKQVIETALTIADKVIVLVGSSFQPRTPKNPFTSIERAGMIFEGLDLQREDKDRVIVAPLQDQRYNDQQWAASVQQRVEECIARGGWTDYPPKVAIIGHTKDDSSYYLKMFPQWALVEHEMNEQLNATDIRELYFEQKNLKFLQSLLPQQVYKVLEDFKKTTDYKRLVEEHDHIKKYRKAWEAAPYPPTFVTTDAVVVQSGHVLLVERGAAPGKNLLALPGGFLDQNETMEQGMLRELREETKLKVPAPVLKGSIKRTKIYDYPERSLRGRTITQAFLIELPSGPLPPVKGSDDAKKAFWKPFSEVKSEDMFEDHYEIFLDMVGYGT